jgi:hypothetical protein
MEKRMDENAEMPQTETQERFIWSVPGRRYYEESVRHIDFLNFIVNLAMSVDTKTKEAAQALLEIELLSGAPECEEDENRLEDLRKTTNEGAGARRSFKQFLQFIYELMICRAVENFLAYISELLALVYSSKPEMLKSSEMVTIEFVIDHTSREELLKALVERKIDKLAYQGMRDLNEELGKRIGFSLFTDQRCLEKAIVVIENRNLIVHNRGIINKIYLTRTSLTDAQLGKPLTLDVDGVGDQLAFLNTTVLDLDRRAAEKFGICRSEMFVPRRPMQAG